MKIINIDVKDKIALGDNVTIVCDNSDYVVKFKFDSEWDDYVSKTMRVQLNSTQYVDVPFAGEQCALPAINSKGSVKIGVYAGALHTTTAAKFDCRESIRTLSGAPQSPVSSVYDKIMQAINDDAFAAKIEIGTVETGAPGAAAVYNSGTKTNAVLNFVIPKGDKGDKGDKGEDWTCGIDDTAAGSSTVYSSGKTEQRLGQLKEQILASFAEEILTQEEYEALVSSGEVQSGVKYYITDSGGENSGGGADNSGGVS